ncbi:SWIM zinc finger family protein [Chitinivorax sp. B]|uniref:SWIM zinc finger family protein n=1 Tax=Chitinivorax sp. B TaxID=2502235 RepID=UPI0010F79295|nr:SWIM zinc finger family protein [Chitinivorax sp. B]
MNLSEQQVLALAPDSGSAKNGKKLGQAAHWGNLGQSSRSLWGECQGSGSKPYQVRVDLADFASKCSCPSFKFPCKHALGLLVLTANQPDLIVPQDEPDWVTEWLDKRGQKATEKETKAKAKAAKATEAAHDPAQQKRAEQREKRVQDGLDACQLWLEDLIRNGMARLANEGMGIWEQQSARLVDAQASGLAARLRPIGELVGAHEDWPNQVLGRLGKLALAMRAYQRLDQLPPALQQDIRQLIGFTVREDEVLATGTVQHDRWQVMGQWVDEGDRVRVQRTWLIGEGSRRYALILQFSPGTHVPFGATWVPGTAFEGELAFWPSAYPIRAMLKGSPSPLPAFPALSHAEPIAALLDRIGHALAANPWLERLPAVISGAVPVQGPQGWQVVDAAGDALPLAGQAHWPWLALTGGVPHDVAVEWMGDVILPLGVMANGRYYPLTGDANA